MFLLKLVSKLFVAFQILFKHYPHEDYFWYALNIYVFFFPGNRWYYFCKSCVCFKKAWEMGEYEGQLENLNRDLLYLTINRTKKALVYMGIPWV